MQEINHFLFHAGGEKILNSIQAGLGIPPERLKASRNVLKKFGNMSSPTVLFVLAEEQLCHPPRPGDKGLLTSFGAGFSAHGALLEW
jgi:predicted naringenin-chalcone synthase